MSYRSINNFRFHQPVSSSPVFTEKPAHVKETSPSQLPLHASPANEKSELRKKAEKRLVQSAKISHEVDWRQFVLMNNTSIIKGTTFDKGYNAFKNILVYQNYLHALQQLGLYFPIKQGKEMMVELHQLLSKLHSLSSHTYPHLGTQSIIQPQPTTSLFTFLFGNKAELFDAADVSSRSAYILQKINREIETAGFVFFFAGYHKKQGGGHVVPCKIQYLRDKNHKIIEPKQIVIYFLNLGEGIEKARHPELGFSNTHPLVSRCNYPSQMSLEEWYRLGPTFLSHIISYSDKIHDLKDNEYIPPCTPHLYELQRILAPLNPALLPSIPLPPAEWQHVGDCSNKAVINVIVDFLSTEKNYSEHDLNLLLLNLHMASLEAAHHSYQRSPNAHHQELLIQATETCGTFLLRSKELIPFEIYLFAAEIIDIILEETKKTLPLTQVATTLQIQSHLSFTFPPITAPEKITFVPVSESGDNLFDQTRYIFPPFDPIKFKDRLEDFVANCRWYKRSRLYKTMILSWPIPQWNVSDDWDRIPLNDIPSILLLLEELPHAFTPPRLLCDPTPLMPFILYTIVDKLCRRLGPQTKLEGFASPFPFNLSEQIYSFHSPEEESRFLKVRAYFLENHRTFEGRFFLNKPLLPKEVDSIWTKEVPQGVKLLFEIASSAYSQSMESLRQGVGLSSNEVFSYLRNPERPELLMQHANLQIGLALQWMGKNLGELNNERVQGELLKCFFSPHAIRDRLQTNPETVGELRAFILKSCQEIEGQTELDSAYAFLIRLGTLFEPFASQHLGIPLNEKILEVYETLIKRKLETFHLENNKFNYQDIVIPLVHLSLLLPPSEERFIDIYFHIFTFRLTEMWEDWHVEEPSTILKFFHLDQLLEKFTRFLLDQGAEEQTVFSRIGKGILDRLADRSSSPPEVWKWASSGVTIQGDFLLNFSTGKIEHSFYKGWLLAFLTEKQKESFGVEYPSSLKRPPAWWLGAHQGELRHVCMSLDGSKVILSEWWDRGKGYTLNRDGFHSKVDQQIVIFSEADRKNLNLLNPEFLPLTFSAISSESIVGHHVVTKKPFLKLDLEPNGTTVTRISDQGKTLPLKLVNLKNLSEGHALYATTLKFASSEEILCFVDEKTQEIGELYFPWYGLSFKRSQGGLESREYPGFYLTHKRIAALGDLSSHAMMLHDPSTGKLKVLLLTPKQEFRSLGTKKEKTKDLKFKRFYVFDLHHAQSEFHIATLSEKLFLILFFKMHGKQEKAFLELKTNRNLIFDEEALSLPSCFFNLKDDSPFTHAFNQRVTLHLIDQLHLLKNQSKKNDFFISQAIESYQGYLRAAGDDKFNAVPCEWRLTEQEEISLLAAFMTADAKIPKIIKARNELLTSVKREAVIVYDEAQSVPPSSFSRILKPKELDSLRLWGDHFPYGNIASPLIQYPNLVPKGYLTNHFSSYYVQAKKALKGGPDPFDFTLLALFTAPTDEDLKLASLLYYVRNFPELFPKGPINDCASFNNLIDAVTHKVKEVAEDDLKFDYHKTVTLTLPPEEKTPSPLPAVTPMKIEVKPFAELYGTLFKREEPKPSLYSELTLFDESLTDPNDPIQQEMLKTYAEAQTKLEKEAYAPITLQLEGFDRVILKLNSMLRKYQSLAEAKEKKVLAYVNTPFGTLITQFSEAEEREFQLLINARQTIPLTPQMIMKKAILTNSTALFDTHRKMFTPDHLKVILEEVHSYYYHLFMAALCTEALAKIKSLAGSYDPLVEKELMGILNYSFNYAPEEYPEIAFAKMMMGKHPLAHHIPIHTWVCRGLENKETRGLQVPANGGKSSYLTYLFILRCKRYGYVPCYIPTQAMFSIEEANLSATLNLLEEELDVLNIDMQKSLSLPELKILYRNLKKVVTRGGNYIGIISAFYSLRSQFFESAVQDDQSEKTLVLQNIMSLIKRKFVFLGDEFHRNFNPLSQALFGTGDFISLKDQEANLLLKCTKHLRTLPKTLSRAEMKRALAQLFTNDLDLIAYLINKKAEMPSSIADMTTEQRHLIRYMRYFLHVLVPKVLKMRTDYDHMFSDDLGGIDMPAHMSTPSYAQYRDPDLTAVLTIKGTLDRGLTEKQVKHLIEKLQNQDKEERRIAFNQEITPTCKMFKEWSEVDLRGAIFTPKLYKKLKNHSEAIEYYLAHHVLRLVGNASEALTSTPAHILDMPVCSILYTATPLHKNACPSALGQMHHDPLFEVRVLAQNSLPKNQNFIFPLDVDDFFKKIKERKDEFKDARYMLDGNGFICHLPNETVAKMWLEASDLKAVVFFKKEDKSKNEVVRLLQKKEGAPTFELQGTHNLISRFKALGVEWDGLRTGFFIDSAHAESADFPVIANSKVYSFGGERFPLLHAIQNYMRDRARLNDKVNQRLIHVIPENERKKQQGDRKIYDTRILNTHSLIEQAKNFKQEILMAAIQDICFKIESLSLKSTQKRHAYKKYSQGFKEKIPRFAAWEFQEKSEKTDTVLLDFAKTFYAKFSFDVPFENNKELVSTLSKLIAKVKAKIPEVSINTLKEALTHIHQKTFVQTQVKTFQFQRKDLSSTRAEPLQTIIPIGDKDYLPFNAALEARAVFHTPHLTENFYFEWNQIHTLRTGSESLKEKFLKPIDFVMIVIDGEKWYAEALSHDAATLQKEHLRTAVGTKHQAFMIRADGVIEMVGRGSLEPKKALIDKILQSTWLQDVLIDVTLLNGHFTDSERMHQRIQKWPHFVIFWGQVLKAQSHPKEYSLAALKNFLPAEIRDEIYNLYIHQQKRRINMSAIVNSLESKPVPYRLGLGAVMLIGAALAAIGALALLSQTHNLGLFNALNVIPHQAAIAMIAVGGVLTLAAAALMIRSVARKGSDDSVPSTGGGKKDESTVGNTGAPGDATGNVGTVIKGERKTIWDSDSEGEVGQGAAGKSSADLLNISYDFLID